MQIRHIQETSQNMTNLSFCPCLSGVFVTMTVMLIAITIALWSSHLYGHFLATCSEDHTVSTFTVIYLLL